MLMLMRMRIDRLTDSSRKDEGKICGGGVLSLSLSLSQEFMATMTIPILTFSTFVRGVCVLSLSHSLVILLSVRSITGPAGRRKPMALLVKFLGFGVGLISRAACATGGAHARENLESQNLDAQSIICVRRPSAEALGGSLRKR